MMRRWILAAFAGLAACGQGGNDAAQPEVAATASASTAASAAAPAVPTPSTPAARKGLVVLDAGGIAVRGEGTAFAATFGTGRDAVDTAVAAAIGAPVKRSNLGECGAGPMEFSDIGPLKLHYQGGKLVGWLTEAGGGIATSDGIRTGITLDELRRERSVRVIADSTLDGEFEYAAADGKTIGGFAKGTGGAATITSLFAGTTCFFR